MGKRNHVTADLRISAEAQLTNSRAFISQLEKIVNQFDLGDKMTKQLTTAQEQLKHYNKILEKVQNKSVISDDELRDLVKAGDAIADIATKTEKLYAGLSTAEWQKFSREYIAQVKAQEQEVLKIKEEYQKKTGKVYDKEIANYNKILAKNKELKAQKEQLAKTGIDDLANKQIAQLNQKLDQQKEKLQDIIALREKSAKAFQDAANKSAQESGFTNYTALKGTKTLTDKQVQKQLGVEKYNEEKRSLTEILRLIKEIEQSEKNINTQNELAINIAKRYSIENVNDLNTLKEQYRIRKDILQTFANDKPRLALQYETELNARLREQQRIRDAILRAENAGLVAQNTAITAGGYTSKQSLSASYSATTKSIANLQGQLSEDGIETIVNNATNTVNALLRQIDNDLRQSNGELNSLDETNKKLATQSERKKKDENVAAEVVKSAADLEKTVVSTGEHTEQGANMGTDKDGAVTREAIETSQHVITDTVLAQKGAELGGRLKGLVDPIYQISKNFPDELPGSGQMKLWDDDTRKQYKGLLADYEHSLFDIERQSAYLEDDKISKDPSQSIVVAKAIESAFDHARKTAMEIVKLLKQVDVKEYNTIEAQMEAMQKHTPQGRPIIVNEEPQLKKGANINTYRELEQELDEIATDMFKLDTMQNEVDVRFVEGKEHIKNYCAGLENVGTVKKQDKVLTQEQNNSMQQYHEILQKNNERLKEVANRTQFLGSALDDFKNKVQYFLSLNYALALVTKTLRSAVDYTVRLDQDMTQIGLVLEQTSSQVWKNYNTYSKMADRLNVTTSEVTAAMKLFYQQGLNTAEVNKMVEASAIAAALGESTMAEASETLTAIMNSYSLAASEAIEVTDKISQVAIVSAADFGEISEAIEKVASSAASAGLDLDHLMGYLAKMIETTREAPTNIGTALKTIVANFTQFKEDPTGLTEEGSDINKVDTALKSVGISLTNVKGEVRDLGDILDELGGIWHTLNRSQKSYLATQIAGTRQQSRFYALMNDYERTMELVGEATGSSGKATAQFGLYQKSLTASTKRLNNEWEKFLTQITSGDGILRKLVDGLTSVLNTINKIGPVATTVFGVGFLGGLRKVYSSLDNFQARLRATNEDILSTSTIIKNVTVGKDVFNNYNYSPVSNSNKLGQLLNQNLGGQITQSLFADKGGIENVKELEQLIELKETLFSNNIKQIEQSKELLVATFGEQAANEALNGSITQQTAAKVTDIVTSKADEIQTKATTAAKWGAVAANFALTAGITLAITGITLLVKGITKLINKRHEDAIAAQEQAKATREEYEAAKDAIDKYKELSSKVITTTEEKEELKQANADLMEQFPGLIDAIDAEGKAYISTTKELDEYLKKKKEQMAIDEANAAKKILDDNKINSMAYDDENKGWAGASKTESEEYLTTELEAAGQRIQTLTDNLKGFAGDDFTWKTDANAGGNTAVGAGAGAAIGFGIGGPIGALAGVAIGGIAGGLANEALTDSSMTYEAAQDKLEEALATGSREKLEEALTEIGNSINEGSQDAFEEYKNNLLNAYDSWHEDLVNGYADLAKNYFGTKIFKADLSSEENNVANTLMNKMFKEEFAGLTEEEIQERIKSGELDQKVEELLTAVKDLTVQEIEAYTTWLENYSSGDYSYNDLQSSINNLDPTVQPVANDMIADLEEIIDINSEVLGLSTDTLKEWSKNRLERISSEWNNLSESEQADFKKGLEKLENEESFWDDFDKLDESDAVAVANFKKKYSDALGKYGEEFFAILLDNPAYDAEAVAKKITGSLAVGQGTGTTNAGADFSAVAGATSHEQAHSLLASSDPMDNQNIIRVGNQILLSAEEISDAYDKMLTDVANSTQTIIDQADSGIETHVQKIRDILDDDNWEFGDDIDFSSLSNAQQQTIKDSQTAIRNLKNQKEMAQELADAYQDLDIAQQANKDFASFRNGTIAIQSTVNELQNLADIYETVKSGAYGYLDIINWIANDTSGQLLAAMDLENKQLALSADMMEVVAEAKRDEALDAIDAQITKLQGQLYYLNAVDTCTEAELQDIKSIDDAKEKLGTNDNKIVSAMGINWQSFTSAFNLNSGSILTNLKNLIKGFVALKKAEKDGTDSSINTGTGGAGTGTETSEANTDEIDIEERKKTIQENINQLQKLRDKFASMDGEELLNGINDIGGGSDGGSGDAYEGMIEKLEHFYNYLRQIEELEAKINKIREKRNLIDATQNYYIDDLKEENELLRQQSILYGNYINDEKEYLAELRNSLSSAYSDWVYFTNDGLVQVKQTEFVINSEEEEERYNAFSELLDEYQNEYNTMLENQNTLYSIQATMVENINSMYDKMLQRLNDVTERLEYVNSISEHKVTMNFGSIDKLPLLSEQIKTTADMLLFADDAVKRLEGDFAVLNDLVKGSPFEELLTWDETLQKFMVNNDKMNSKTQAQYEAQGYNWEDVVSWVESVAAASQKVTDSLQESNSQLMDARESLKELLEERISTIDEIFEKATEEMNKFYGIYESKIESLGTENDLFGVKSENLDKQFEYLKQTATHAKVLLADLKENNQMILETLMQDYGQYVDMIDGVAYLNKMAIEETDSLTEGQRADLLQLYQLYYDSNDQIEELNDKFYDYISQIEELEEAKRDAIIDLKQQVHDELIRLDQEEIDDLSEKYDKMNALDNEYYSKLQQRINDARDARSRLQDQQNLTQMQNRLSVLQQDNSGQYNSELVELQRQINEQLQAQADNNIDLEMERIAREQQQREEDRQMQITQMENLLTFKDENGIYWQETQGYINEGNATVIGLLASTDEFKNQSQEAQQKNLEELQDLAETASAGLQTGREYIADNFRQSLENLVKAPVEDVSHTLTDAAQANAASIGTQIETGTKTFLNTMDALFKYLAILTGKTTDKGYTTGNLSASGVYTMPTKEPPKPVVTTPPASSNTSSGTGSKTVGVGARVKAGSGAKIYTSSIGSRGGSQYYANDPIYTVLQILGNRALVRHHKLSSGYTGWFNLSDLTAYKHGGYVNYTGPAWVDGTNNNPEAFLNAKQTALFETLRDALVKVPTFNSGDGESGDNITIENLTIDVKELADTDSIDKVVKTVKDSIYKDATSGNNMKINRRR